MIRPMPALLILTLVSIVLPAPARAQATQPADQPAARKTYTEAPKMTIDVNKKYTATFETDKGKFVCELNPKDAPKSVNSFVFLARDHFYDGLTFHRVVPGFVIQGGDPKGDGSGGPGYTLPLETADATHKHIAGALAMARAQDLDSAGCQFYITLAPTPELDGGYTVFGQIIDGMDTVKALGKVAVGGPNGDTPLTPPIIKTITIKEE